MSDRITTPPRMREVQLMRRLSVLLLVLGAVPAARAQVPDSGQAPPPPAKGAGEPEATGSHWRTSYFPYLTGGANDSPVLSFRVRHWQPAEYEARNTYTAAF